MGHHYSAPTLGSNQTIACQGNLSEEIVLPCIGCCTTIITMYLSGNMKDRLKGRLKFSKLRMLSVL